MTKIDRISDYNNSITAATKHIVEEFSKQHTQKSVLEVVLPTTICTSKAIAKSKISKPNTNTPIIIIALHANYSKRYRFSLNFYKDDYAQGYVSINKAIYIELELIGVFARLIQKRLNIAQSNIEVEYIKLMYLKSNYKEYYKQLQTVKK